MTSWHPSLYQYWYAVARADRVGTKPIAISLLDTHVAIARTPSGWIALEDRCPHRHAPLSAGCVVGGHLRCPYHGWSFAPDGQLCEIPGRPPDTPLPGIRVRSFAVREADGFLWLRPSDEGMAEPSALARETDPHTRRFIWNTRWSSHVVDAMENFLDPLHTHFIHTGLVRSSAIRTRATASFRSTEEGFTVEYEGGPRQSGLLYRLFESERKAELAHFAAPGSARLEYQYANGSLMLFDLHFTPRTLCETDVFVAVHVEGRWAPAWAIRLLVWPFLKKVNDQDAAMLRLQAENLRRFGAPKGASTDMDIVRSALERFWREGTLPDSHQAKVVQMML